MGAALLIARKDLRQRMRDRSAILVALVVPMVMASIFGLIFHGVAGGSVTFTYGLADGDHGPAAAAFRSQVLAPLERQGLVHVRVEPDLAAARHDADRGRVSAAFVFPAGYSASVSERSPKPLVVLGDVDTPIGAQVAQAIAGSFTARLDTIRITRTALGRDAPSTAQLAAAPSPIGLADVSTASRQLDVGTFYAAGMAVFFLFFTVQFGVSTLTEERRDGTLARMLAAPIPRPSILAGKILTSVVLGLLSMTVLALATSLLLGAHWGNPIGVAILIVCGVVAATAVMALVVTFARTPDQAGSWQSMVALVLGLLGGTFFPVSRTGGLLATASLGTPQAWFLRGIQDLTGGAGPGAVLGPACAMLAFAGIAGSLTLLRAGRLTAR